MRDTLVIGIALSIAVLGIVLLILQNANRIKNIEKQLETV